MRRLLFIPILTIVYACSSYIPQDSTPHPEVFYTYGNEAVIQDRNVSLDANQELFFSESPDRTIAFWQQNVPAGLSNGKQTYRRVAAFLTDPLSGQRNFKSVGLGDSIYYTAADIVRSGTVTVAVSKYHESGGYALTVVENRNMKGEWSAPEELFVSDERQIIRLEADSILSGSEGKRYILIRYRLGKVKEDRTFRLYSSDGPKLPWKFMGTVPGSDDLSTFDNMSFDSSPDGKLAIAFVAYKGHLKVLESKDRGRTWQDLGSPKRPSVPGFRLPRRSPLVRDSMPSIRRVAGGWGLAWEAHVSVPRGINKFDEYVDTLFARYDDSTGKWAQTVTVNEFRTIIRRKLSLFDEMGKSGVQRIKELSEEGRGTDLRYANLATASTGRLAVVWRELRGEWLRAVVSISDDGGRTWSAGIVLNPLDKGDVHSTRGLLSSTGDIYRAIAIMWPGRSSIQAAGDLSLKVSEIIFQ